MQEVNVFTEYLACEQAHILGHTSERQRANSKAKRSFRESACAPKCEPARRLRNISNFVPPESRANTKPLTSMPTLSGRDEPWPFFHFWRHHFWPKLASSMLNFCRRRRSFQWCPDQSNRPNGTWDMHKNAQKVERKNSHQNLLLLHLAAPW